jgi:phage baseplate assembly protein gpV
MQDQSPRLRPIAAVLAAALASLGALVAAAPLSADGASASYAHAARTTSVNEQGRLHLVSKHGFTLNEQGTASGTIKGAITVELKIVSTSKVTAEIKISPPGGSISAYGSASYHKGATSASFAGSLSIKGGTGSYANARGSGLSFSGTIASSNKAIAIRVSGSVSE